MNNNSQDSLNEREGKVVAAYHSVDEYVVSAEWKSNLMSKIKELPEPSNVIYMENFIWKAAAACSFIALTAVLLLSLESYSDFSFIGSGQLDSLNILATDLTII